MIDPIDAAAQVVRTNRNDPANQLATAVVETYLKAVHKMSERIPFRIRLEGNIEGFAAEIAGMTKGAAAVVLLGGMETT